jgi:hypothetical protein
MRFSALTVGVSIGIGKALKFFSSLAYQIAKYWP